MLEVGQRVRNVRRPDVIGVVTSLDAPNNKWATRPQDHRVLVKYPRLTKLSNGNWKGGVLDELPIDLMKTGTEVHEVINAVAMKAESAHESLHTTERKGEHDDYLLHLRSFCITHIFDCVVLSCNRSSTKGNR